MSTSMSFGSLSRPDKGYVAFLALLMIAFFGLLAGTHSLAVISLAGSARGLDEAADRHLLEDRLELVVSETLTRLWETHHGAPIDFQSCLAGNLERLQVPGLRTRVVSFSPWPGFSEEASGVGRGGAGLSAPSASFLSLAGPALRNLAGELVAESPQGRVVFASDHREGRPPEETSIGFRFVAVPLVQTPRHAYLLPDELTPRPAEPRVTEDPSHTAFAGPEARIPGWGLEEAPGPLSYRFRRQACLAAAYAEVFSSAYVSRALLAAGPGLVHRLDLAEHSTSRLAGLTRKNGLACLDLGLAGSGEFSGRKDRGNVLVLATAQSGLELTLGQVSNTESTALVLLVIGPPKGTVVVKLGPCARPVLLIAMHATLLPTGGDWLGGLMLGPDCRVEDTGHPMRVAHLSHAAAGSPLPGGIFQASLKAPGALAAVSPMVGYVVTEVLRHGR